MAGKQGGGQKPQKNPRNNRKDPNPPFPNTNNMPSLPAPHPNVGGKAPSSHTSTSSNKKLG
jgi:hypothetical protein